MSRLQSTSEAKLPQDIAQLLSSVGHACLKVLKQPKTTSPTWVILTQAESALRVVKLSTNSLISEVTITKGLVHPQTVRFISSGRIGNFFSIQTAYFTNGDLSRFISQGPLMSEKQTARLFLSLANVVAYLRAERVAHLDLKPENIAIDATNKLALIDFGHARKDANAYFIEGKRNGSRKLNSPERFKPGPFNGFQADMYSLGVVLFYMLTSTYPFTQATVDCSMFCEFLKHPVQFLYYCQALAQELFHSSHEKWSADLVDLLSGLLHPEPSKRLTIEQVLQHRWLATQIAEE